MPQGDRTGPVGQGPMTGRNLGFCSGYNTPGFTKGIGRNMRKGMGNGRGKGQGRGFARGHFIQWPFSGSSHTFGWPKAISKEDEIKMLKTKAEELNLTRQDIEKRIIELENQGK